VSEKSEASSRGSRRGANPAKLDPAKLPRHVAIVLGGETGCSGADLAAAAAARGIVEAAAGLGIGMLTLCGSKELCAFLERAGVREAGEDAIRVELKADRGRDEILDAARRIAQEVQRGRLSPRSIDARTIDRFIEPPGTPELDLLILPGGQQRLTNVLLWQMAYAEMYIAESPWTELGREALVEALASYQARERRFGQVPAAAGALSLSKAG
jgi:putative undecaprenyl diphosphate synthase